MVAHVILSGNCLLRVFNYFSCGPCCYFHLKGATLLLVRLWIPIFISESEVMVKSLREPVPNPCDLSCSAIYSVTQWPHVVFE